MFGFQQLRGVLHTSCDSHLQHIRNLLGSLGTCTQIHMSLPQAHIIKNKINLYKSKVQRKVWTTIVNRFVVQSRSLNAFEKNFCLCKQRSARRLPISSTLKCHSVISFTMDDIMNCYFPNMRFLLRTNLLISIQCTSHPVRLLRFTNTTKIMEKKAYLKLWFLCSLEWCTPVCYILNILRNNLYG